MISNLPSNRLLVVDDEPAVGRLIKNAAESADFEVLVTKNPATFSEKARIWCPTLLMVDLGMRRIDGIQLLRQLAADKCTAYVILMSGADSKVVESATLLGRAHGLKMAGVLQKPVQLATLRKFLARFQVAKALLSADLAGAIATDQLFLEYQLKLDCRAARITGAEALVRWRHPSLGIIHPDQFIPLAEETDLIHKLTDWVVVAATRQLAAWHSHNRFLEIAVNVSAKDVQDLSLPDRLHKHCRAAGVDCASITLELTETGAMREALQMMDVLTRLRLKGFKLSIDDFGTGFSSLVQLQRMPFSEVKIDRSFVIQMLNNESCRVIVEIVIDLARKLGLRSVAEGVEDEATLHSLIKLGCDMAQGYHLSRPIAADRIPAFISEYQMIRGVRKAPKSPLSSPFTNVRAWRRRKSAPRHHAEPSSLASLEFAGELLMRILLVEDNAAMAAMIEQVLCERKFIVDRTDLGEDAIEIAKLYDYDIIILDLTLPDIDGYTVLSRLRASRVSTPVLIMSGRAEMDAKIKALGVGADDFMVKPFNEAELIARIQAVVRRSKGHSESTIRTGKVVINISERVATVDDKRLQLTVSEYSIFELLSLRKGTTVEKATFINHLYGGMDEPELKIIDVFVCKLRKKLAKATGGEHYIETVWGRGYVLRDPVEPTQQLRRA